MTGKTLIARNLAILSYFALLALLVITTFTTDIPEEASKLPILAVKLVPLLIFIKGILTNNTRSHQWLCFVVLLYFTGYSIQAYLSEWAIMPVIATLITMSVFICSMMFVHWFNKDRAKAIADTQPE